MERRGEVETRVQTLFHTLPHFASLDFAAVSSCELIPQKSLGCGTSIHPSDLSGSARGGISVTTTNTARQVSLRSVCPYRK